jgi:hypothetical protein
MLQFARALSVNRLLSIVKTLKAVVARSNPRAINQENATPTKYTSAGMRTPDSGPNVRMTPQSGAPSRMTSAVTADSSAEIKSLLSSIECVRAVASISSLPSLRRHLVGRDAVVVEALSDLVGYLPLAHDVLSAANEETRTVLQAVEQAALVTLETMSHVRHSRLFESTTSCFTEHACLGV